MYLSKASLPADPKRKRFLTKSILTWYQVTIIAYHTILTHYIPFESSRHGWTEHYHGGTGEIPHPNLEQTWVWASPGKHLAGSGAVCGIWGESNSYWTTGIALSGGLHNSWPSLSGKVHHHWFRGHDVPGVQVSFWALAHLCRLKMQRGRTHALSILFLF